MLVRYLSIVLLAGGVVLGASISDYSESALNSRAPDLNHVSNYHRSEYDGLVEIRYKYVIKPGHYGWLWMFPLAAGLQAGEDANNKGHTHYFDSWNGDYVGDNKQEARRTVANRREGRRRRIEAENRRREQLQREAEERSRLAAAWVQSQNEWFRLMKEAADREQRQREAAERDKRQREAAERERRQREASEQARRQRQAAEQARRQREAAEQQRRQKEAAEQQRRQKEAAERELAAAMLSYGNALLLADKYEEALSKFDQVLLASFSSEEALRKRNLVNNVLEGNKWWGKGDKELQAANESRLKRDYNNALTHYLRALAQYRLAVGGFEKAMLQDSRFRGKRVQAQAAVTDLEGTIAEVKREAESKGVQLDVNWNVEVLMKDVINEGEEQNINAEAETHVVVDRG